MKTAHAEKIPVSFGKHAAAQLVAGYSEESVLYQMLLGLTSRQRRCLGDGGDLSEFVELIDQKDAVLGQIEQLETELAPLRTHWVSASCMEREKVAGMLNPVFDEIIGTIQKTVSLEQDNERLLEVRRRELSKVLSDLRRWRCSAPSPVLASCVQASTSGAAAVTA